jgi:two-component system LytT family response regulator
VNRKIIRALIVDDEALARRGLKHRLAALDDVKVAGEARNVTEALRQIRQLEPDVVFLDIQMPGRSGFEVLSELDEKTMPLIVFVTAYDEYAVQAFEVNAIDYLLKPVEEERLEQAVDRIRALLASRDARKHKQALLNLLSEVTGEPIRRMSDLAGKDVRQLGKGDLARLAIKDGSTTTWVRQEDIEWIEAAGDYMCVHALGETHIMRKTMKELEDELQADFLQRIHRSTIVNVRHVTEMRSHINGEYFLKLESGRTFKLSRTYKDKLRYLQPS